MLPLSLFPKSLEGLTPLEAKAWAYLIRVPSVRGPHSLIVAHDLLESACIGAAFALCPSDFMDASNERNVHYAAYRRLRADAPPENWPRPYTGRPVSVPKYIARLATA